MPSDFRLAKIFLLSSLISGITLVHYFTDMSEGFLHVALRELYFLPILLSAFWYGLAGGLASSLIVTALYIPFIILRDEGFPPHTLGNWLEVGLFNLVAGLLGWLRTRDLARQKELCQAQCLASMGSAVAALAHDMKTPLIAIGGFVSQVRRKMADKDASAPKLEIALSQVARLETMVKDMLVFARNLEILPVPGEIKHLVQETLPLASSLAEKKQVVLQYENIPGVPKIPFDYQRLQQALLNLIINAVEASPENETVLIKTLPGKASITLEVIDRGLGVPKEKEEEVFKPFMTTKREGTGLGLPIVKKIIEAHEGKVTIHENPGGGAIFRLTLPLKRHDQYPA